MIKVDIEYICDECGKTKKEKTIVVKGYEDVNYAIENNDKAYMPSGWSYDVDKKDKVTLNCSKCTKKKTPKDAIWVA
jgi:ribosomal protein L44E